MAYNSYFPVTYNPGYFPNYNQSYQQQAQSQQIHQSGFVLVQSEQEARAYPVAPGNSVTFKDERQPYCYVKTMGFNQLDQPRFERYRLVKEDDPQEPTGTPQTAQTEKRGNDTEYATKSEVSNLRADFEAFKQKMTTQMEKKTPKAKKLTNAEDNTDEQTDAE